MTRYSLSPFDLPTPIADYSSLVSICSVMPEELVPSKGEAMSTCQVGLLNADDVHSLPFQEIV